MILELSVGEIALRLLGAMLIGMIIGTEREYTHRPAGMRTHMLVAIGACAVMVTGQLLFCTYYPLGAMPDPARMAAQVITGVGFLGAGTILREGFSVKGLTTAASIWAVACLGIAIGGGYYALAAIGTVCIFVTLSLFDMLQKKMLRISKETYYINVTCKDVPSVLNAVDTLVKKSGGTSISGMEVNMEDHGNISIRFALVFSGRDVERRPPEFVAELSKEEAVLTVSLSAASAE